jgi:hypothetical protein
MAVEKDFSSFRPISLSCPTVCWVIPNLSNEMHDGTIAQGDAWLKNHISPQERKDISRSAVCRRQL